LRVPGAAPLHVEPFRKLGASPLSMPLGEVLPAVQNRTIDGAIAAFVVFTAFKYYDIAKPITVLPGSFAVVSGLVNRKFMASLGPELEAIVREESRKAEEVFGDWNINDIQSKEDIWKKNGGEVITMSPDESKRYIDAVSPVAASILSANPKVKEDYEALLAAAKRYR
jgi:TRAP-type transport system periplasmic protein